MEDYELIRFEFDDVDHSAGHVEADHCGVFLHKVFPVFVPEDWTLERAQAAIDERIEPQYCQHSYDCCGHFYGGRATVIGENYLHSGTKVVWVQRSYVQNV